MNKNRKIEIQKTFNRQDKEGDIISFDVEVDYTKTTPLLHKESRFLYILEGEGKIKVLDREFDLRPGVIIALLPWQISEIVEITKPLSYYLLVYSFEVLNEVIKKTLNVSNENIDMISLLYNNNFVVPNEIELKKIQLQSVKPDSIRKIYERCLKDETRFNFWRFLEIWYNDDLKNLQKRDIPFDVNIEKCKVALKSFVSSVYCNLGYRGAFFDVLKEVLNDLKNDDMTLHDYGLLKLASRFADNEKNYEISEFENSKLQNIFENNLKDFFILLDDLSDNKDKNIVKKALNFYKLKKWFL